MTKLFLHSGLLLATLLLTSCSTTYKNQSLQGKVFPSVRGTSLEGKDYKIPEDFQTEATLFLIGYKQDSQFDLDRWLIGLDMKNVEIPVYELPTIAGLFPRMFSTKIDSGMRKGIPKPLWKGVITIYKDGKRVQEFTGNENPRNGRVILIDKNGRILYFHDGGFSVAELNRLIKSHKKLQNKKSLN